MSELSHQAQAVLDAAFGRWMEIDDIDDDIPGKIAVAALRAAADQVVPEEPDYMRNAIPDAFDRQESIRAEILAIAAELENHQ